MAINSQLSTTESKKLSKQAEQIQSHKNGDHLEGQQLGGGRGLTGAKVQGLRSTEWQVQNRQGDVKNSIGNGVARECICMNHAHELRRGAIAGGNGAYGVEELKGETLRPQ